MKYMIKKSEWHLMTDADHGFGVRKSKPLISPAISCLKF